MCWQRLWCNKASDLEKSAQDATGGAWQGMASWRNPAVLDLGESWHRVG